jgi:hypothetical protein
MCDLSFIAMSKPTAFQAVNHKHKLILVCQLGIKGQAGPDYIEKLRVIALQRCQSAKGSRQF